jgi:alpha-galactosidase
VISLQNPFMRLAVRPEAAAWDLRAQAGFPEIHNAGISFAYQNARGRKVTFDPGQFPAAVTVPLRLDSPQGELDGAAIRYGPSADGLVGELTVGLIADQPLCLWRLSLTNQGSQPVFIDRLTMIDVARIKLSSEAPSVRVLTNGWSSWAFSGSYGAGDRQRHTRLGPIQAPQNYNPGTPVQRGIGQFSSDFFAVMGDQISRRGLAVGFLSQLQHFGSLQISARGEPALSMWANGDETRLDPGREMRTDWSAVTWLDLDEPDPLGGYLQTVAREYGLDPARAAAPPVGWCSWYQYYTHIDAGLIEKNLRAAEALRPRLPLGLVQIDDGFERQPGDWFDFSKGFTAGVAPLAGEIRAAGFTPGLWLAPFIVHPKANLVKDHPEYILCTPNGRRANAGYIWDRFTYGLDLTVPGALDYAAQVVGRAAHEWGFPYLKLDFLYAGALAGRRHDPTLTRAQALRRGLEALRAAAGAETTLLACGCPLGSAIGLFDAMRIGTDVSGSWTPDYAHVKRLLKPEPHIPSLRNALQNILVRAPLHRRWWMNDPDCLIVRPGTGLTLAEVHSLASVIALTGGSLLLSDDLPALPAERLRIAEALLPVIGARARVLDWLENATPARLRVDLDTAAGHRVLLAAFNWSERPQAVQLRLADYGLTDEGYWSARSFWDGRCYPSFRGVVEIGDIPPHGVKLLAVTPRSDGEAVYCGSDLHISQGMEVAGWQPSAEGVVVDFGLPRLASGVVDLILPRAPRSACLDGKAIQMQELDGVYRFPIAFEKSARLDVRF